MATSIQVAPALPAMGPLALWHLLSFDAPTVAALWVWFIARAEHIRLPLAAPVSMALAVWILYAADRLLDVRNLPRAQANEISEFEARHFFHHRHRRLFLLGIAAAAIALAALLDLLDTAAIHLYLIEALLLLAWLAIVHATRSAHRLPKEIAVGIFFSAAVFIPTIAREPSLRPSLAPIAIFFVAVCSLNCLFLYAWEHENIVAEGRRLCVQPPHFTTRLAITHLSGLATGIAAACGTSALAETMPARAISTACILSIAVLLLLNHNRQRISRINLRAAADLALLTPLFLLRFLR